ncbi:MAG: hypothetical protein QW728_00010, partial [Thermoplasmata archaeon]
MMRLDRINNRYGENRIVRLALVFLSISLILLSYLPASLFCQTVIYRSSYSSNSGGLSNGGRGTPNVIFTEFVYNETGLAMIELFNPSTSEIMLAGYNITLNGQTHPIGNILLNTGFLDTRVHTSYIVKCPENFSTDGFTISIHLPGYPPEDTVLTGIFGNVPAPCANRTVARIWSSSLNNYTDRWTIALNNTNNAVNPEFPTTYDPEIALSEVLYNPGSHEGFIELWYRSNSSWNFSQKPVELVCNRTFVINTGELNVSSPVLTINYSMLEPDFLPNPAGDNIYLVVADQSIRLLLDQVGWDSPHAVDRALGRNRSKQQFFAGKPVSIYNGSAYNDTTSILAGWEFDMAPSRNRKQNNPPSAEPIGTLHAFVDQRMTKEVNSSDPDGDILSFSLSAQPYGMTVSSGGVIEYVPYSNQTGVFENIVLNISDSEDSIQLNFNV